MMGLSYTAWLAMKASVCWAAGEPLPTDLFMEMNNAGMDVDLIEEQFHLIDND